MESTKDVVMHWGGKLVRKPEVEYVGGKVETFCKMDLDLACHWTLLEWYNIVDPECTHAEFYFKKPNETLESRFDQIKCDEDIIKWTETFKHKDTIEFYAVGISYALQVVSPKGDVLFKRVTSDSPLSNEWGKTGNNGDQCSKGDSGGVGEPSGVIAEGEHVGSSEKGPHHHIKETISRSRSRGRLENKRSSPGQKLKKLTPRRSKKRLFDAASDQEPVDKDQAIPVVVDNSKDDVQDKGEEVEDEFFPYWLIDEIKIPENDDIFEADTTQAEGCVEAERTIQANHHQGAGDAEKGSAEANDLGHGQVDREDDVVQHEYDGEVFVGDLDEEDVESESNDFDSDVEFKRKKFELKVGQTFVNVKKFREALVEWNVKKGYEVEYIKNEGNRVTAKCNKGCSWRIHASKVGRDTTFMIKTLTGEHTCTREYANKHCTSTYIAHKFIDTLRDNPGCSLSGVRNQIKRDLMVDVSMHQIYKMKRKAKEIMAGSDMQQYQKLWDYAEAIRQSNPGSIVRIQNDVPSDNGPVTFKRMFLGLAALKEGFLAGCRPLIGLDACFMKTAFGGQLISAIGRDGNDNMYPIAFTVAESESCSSWRWFLDILREFIGESNDGAQWCFITDRQKGLVHAIREVFPNAEHRFCVKHMFENFKEKFKGGELHEKFWRAASVGNPMEFKLILEELKALDGGAAIWLGRLEPHLWARSHFSTESKCDVIVNNMNESWNAYILEARDMPIIDMLNWIRRKLMARIKVKKDGMDRHMGRICPRILDKVQKQIILSRTCFATMGSDNKFEVVCGSSAVVVDLSNKTCTCRFFDLTGIPCKHAVACIQLKRDNVLNYVHMSYSKDVYMRTYSYMLHPMPSSEFWSETGMHQILPPDIRKQPGRPKKLRKRGPNEKVNTNPNRASKKGQENHCRKCLQTGHNVRKCPNATHPQSTLNKGGPPKQVNKGGRPKSRNAVVSGGIRVRPTQLPSAEESSHAAMQVQTEQVDIDMWAAYASSQPSHPSPSVTAN